MSSDIVHFDRLGVSLSSQMAPPMQYSNMSQSDVSITLPADHPIDYTTAIAVVALQDTGGDPRMNDEETHEARIERLGRQRPEKFKTLWAEIGFVFSIVMSQVMTVSLFSIVIETSHLYSANRARMMLLLFLHHPVVNKYSLRVLPARLKHVPHCSQVSFWQRILLDCMRFSSFDVQLDFGFFPRPVASTLL